MSEMPAGDTHDVIHRAGAVVAVVVPIAEYQRLRQAAEEQRINEEFDAARAGYAARRDAGLIRMSPTRKRAAVRGLPGLQSWAASAVRCCSVRAVLVAAGPGRLFTLAL
jgi:hypothetical protein